MSDDVIYRQEASYALNTIRVSKNETWYSLYQKVLDVFSKLPSAEPEQQWMPCSEKLPEEDGLYLVTTSKGQVQVQVFNHNGNSEEYWMRCNKAWMPMPEPYKEESEDKG